MFIAAQYVHDLDPVIFSAGPLAVRWYGLAYLAGFLTGWWLLKKMAERSLYPIAPDKISDFIALCALGGVFLGGRLGYVLFYMLPSHEGRAQIAADPLTIIKVWEGGMASHGGILGICVCAYFYARKNQISWAALGDGLVCVAPLGVFFGRLANFINGELYGHVAKGVAWAVKFPGSLFNPACDEFKSQNEAMVSAIQAAEGTTRENLIAAYETGANGEPLLNAAVRESDAVKDAIEPYLLPRHPSQIYEGLLEGLLLFGVLTFLRFRYPRLPHGLLTGLFFLLYAAGRIFVEQYRVPDSAMVGPLTKGQFYSLFFILIGAAFVFHAWRQQQRKPVSSN
ncbi:MAG: prolipoprotein diacylglyceryl transferase [Verrucomicrobiota bacterium JB023]|nr:prolipoprotein diacylglyceryl transferase [Verrucomicrobiota bacterium JB023]